MQNSNLILRRVYFETPIARDIIRWFAIILLHFIAGWRVRNLIPPYIKKCILIGAPHTSNWDMVYMLLVAITLRLPLYWLGKHTIFRFPFGFLMRWLGGIPVDRSKSDNRVEQLATILRDSSKSMFLVMQPEGTRDQVRVWKTGFYYTALQAGVPIALGELDYHKKRGGVAGVIYPSGNYNDDLKSIKSFYMGVTPRHPSKSVIV